jgi:hypothetical protein
MTKSSVDPPSIARLLTIREVYEASDRTKFRLPIFIDFRARDPKRQDEWADVIVMIGYV